MWTRNYIIVFFLMVNSSSTFAHSPWYLNTSLTQTSGTYQRDENKKSFTKYSIMLQMDYFEKLRFAFSVTKANYFLKKNNPTVSQNQLASRLSYALFNDTLGAKLTTQILGFKISDSFSDWHTVGTTIRYQKFKNTAFMDISFLVSDSQSDTENFQVTQFTPRFSLNHFSSYLRSTIWTDFISENQNNNTYFVIGSSLEYYINNKNWIIFPNSIKVGGTLGKRRYRIEQDNYLVYNTNDKQSYHLFFSVNWRLVDNGFFYVVIGHENFFSQLDQEYKLNHLTFNLSKTW